MQRRTTPKTMSATPSSLPRLASTFARVALLIYALLIIHASWYPFSGWHISGIAPFDFVTAPLPHYWTLFDVATNVVAYVPLGALLVFALYPRIHGLWAVALAIVCGVFLSGVMETVQTFLPSRVSSNLDFFTNSAGTIIGAVLGFFFTQTFLERSRFLQVRRRWFMHEAGRALVVLALWPLAQIYPQAYLFGHGQLVPILSDWLSALTTTPIDLGDILRRGATLSAEQYWLAEAIITATGLTGALLTLIFVMRKNVPSAKLVTLMLALALIVKALASALMFTPQNAFAWLTPGAQGGILFGSVMLFGLAYAPPAAQRRVAAAMLLVGLIVVNMIPVNPYFMSTLQTWTQGKFLNFFGAAQFLSLLWPFFALWFLLHPIHAKKKA